MIAAPPPFGVPCRTSRTVKGMWMPTSPSCPVKDGLALIWRLRSVGGCSRRAARQEAVAALEVATPKKRTTRSDLDDDDLYGPGWDGPDAEWESVYIDALAATGQVEHAQRLRWAAFEDRLSVERLRSYLKALPDFEDVLAEERAMQHALRFPNFSVALYFFHEWPAHRQAADLIVARHVEINGNLYYLLDPAARWLEGAHPLAATLLRRAMIEDTLDGAKSKRYRHAARHLAECQALASVIGDYGEFEPHGTFVSRLRTKHSRKSGFWTFIAGPTADTASHSD